MGKLNEELDLDDDLAGSRVLELPEDLIDENAFESTTPDELLAEEEAVKLSRRPLDEILDLGNDEDAAESNVVSLTPALDEEDSAIQFSLEEDPDELE